MKSASNLLLAVWQDVSRHLDIAESTESIAALLSPHVPLRAFVVRRLEGDQRRMRTVGAWPTATELYRADEVHFAATEWRRMERWVRQRQFLHRARDGKRADSLLLKVLHSQVADDWFLAPLVGEHGSVGLLLAIAHSNRKFSASDSDVLAMLREPLAVTLDNDARLHELAALRDAAEADRQTLLRRLGRQDIGDTIIGDSSGLAQVMERVEMVSRSDVPVLILGETGTGKELVARAIHNRSDRHAGPFLRVNCGAIPRELIDSQLFGHEKGSFTGAAEARQGWFERADMGTLFLDEIGELPLDAQVRFLRVLQDGFIERVGGHQPIRVNVRIVAATHRDLASMVRENRFREDLWYRVAVFPILLPPLRDRAEDIPALARHFAERAALRFGLAPVTPSEAQVALLQSYDWPGNIRELGAVIDRAAILGNGQSLELAAALGLASPRRPHAGAIPRVRDDQTDELAHRRIETLDDAMRQHIESALRATHGRVEGRSGAAQLLAINPHTLRARMRKLGIKWARFRGDQE